MLDIAGPVNEPLAPDTVPLFVIGPFDLEPRLRSGAHDSDLVNVFGHQGVGYEGTRGRSPPRGNPALVR